MENFINEHLYQLRTSTFVNILTNQTLRKVFEKFIQIGHTHDSEMTILLKRYELYGKIMNNIELINNSDTYESLLNSAPSLLWESRLRSVALNIAERKNFLYILKNLSNETLVEIICHDDYNRFMRKIRGNSEIFKKILRDIYSEANQHC